MKRSQKKKLPVLARMAMAVQALRGNLGDPPQWLQAMFAGSPSSASGVDVVPQTAITLSAVYDCVNILSQTIGALPLSVYEHQGEQKIRRPDHPLHPILHTAPNPEMTAYTWRAVVMTHLGLWGNHYSQIIRDRLGRVKALWPLSPQRVRVLRKVNTHDLYYHVAPMYGDTGTYELLPRDVLHIKGLSMNGLVGLSPVGAARESIGLGLAAQEYGARFFSNDANPGGFLEHPGELDDEEYERLKKSIEDQTRGLANKHRMIILEEGMKWNAMSMPPEDAQFLQTRDFQVRDVARFYRMPLYKLSENLSTKNSNVEQLAIEFITDTIMPWVFNIEAEIDAKLLGDESGTLRSRFMLDELLRGDQKSRYDAYAIGRQWGILSANEIRGKEGLNPIGAKGDVYLEPLNMVPAGSQRPAAGAAAPAAPSADDPAAEPAS